MDQKPSVLILSFNSGVRIALSHVLKKNGFSGISHPKVGKPEEFLSSLVDQFKKNLTSKNESEKVGLIIVNCRSHLEYRRSLETLSKELMKNRIKWSQEGISFTHDEINDFKNIFLINHYVLGADFVYQIENNERVRVSFGDINTDEFLSCANLFGELGMSFSTYFEKDLEPTGKDSAGYNNAMKLGKQAVMKKMAGGNISGDEVNEIIDKKLSECSLIKKAEKMESRLLRDIKLSLDSREKRKEITKKRSDIVESADTFKQYLALKDEALAHKESKNYQGMEKALKKAIDLLEGAGESGQKSLFDTYIELGKSQIQQKKFISSQRNAANARKIRKEAPSPQRLMGECQMGQATEALKSGQYDEAAKFFDKAGEYMEESKKLSQEVEVEEQEDNEKEIAISITQFQKESRKIAEEDPNAKKVLQSSIAFNLLANTASKFKKKHKIVEEGEIHPDISPEDIVKELEIANKLLKTPADSSKCTEHLNKLFLANAEETVEQLLKLGGLLGNILSNISDTQRYERALIFVRCAMGYDFPQMEQVKKKFGEINFNIASDHLENGVKLVKEFFKNPGAEDSQSKKNKALIHFQKALHQNTDITSDVIGSAVPYVKSVQKEFGNSEGIMLANMFLSIEFSGSEKQHVEAFGIIKKEIQAVLDKARKTALEAANNVLEKKQVAAREMYNHAIEIDEMAAFKAVSGLAKDFKAKGEVKNAYSLYSWIARVDRNETDMQYLNAAWCCILLGDRDRAKKHIEAALLINKNIMEEAAQMDPEFEESEVMKYYKEVWGAIEKDKEPQPPQEPRKVVLHPPPKPRISPKEPPRARTIPPSVQSYKAAPKAAEAPKAPVIPKAFAPPKASPPLPGDKPTPKTFRPPMASPPPQAQGAPGVAEAPKVSPPHQVQATPGLAAPIAPAPPEPDTPPQAYSKPGAAEAPIAPAPPEPDTPSKVQVTPKAVSPGALVTPKAVPAPEVQATLETASAPEVRLTPKTEPTPEVYARPETAAPPGAAAESKAQVTTKLAPQPGVPPTLNVSPQLKPAQPVQGNKGFLMIKKAAQLLAAKKQKEAYVILKRVHQADPGLFSKLISQKPVVKNMPVYLFYLKKVVQQPKAVAVPKAPGRPLNREDMAIVMQANKSFMQGKRREAVTSLIQAMKKDNLILVKACGASEKFTKSALMKFYFDNKAKFPRFLGFEPKP